MASDEIAKANDIILKRSREIMELRKTIEGRTEFALQQEVTVRDKEKQLLAQIERTSTLAKELKVKEEESRNFIHKYRAGISSQRKSKRNIQQKYPI